MVNKHWLAYERQLGGTRMRLIDADKFEATIRSHIISTNHNAIRLNTNQIANNDAILDCIDWLHKEPTVCEWIPVSERLPEHAKKLYFTTLDYGGLGTCVSLGLYVGDGKWDNPCVSAWQPLPEPYELKAI